MIENGQIRQAILLVAAAVGVYLCFSLAVPFIASLTWALALAIVLIPLQLRLERRLINRSLASLLIVVAVALVLGVLVVLIGRQVLSEAASGAEHMEEVIRRWNPGVVVETFPRAASLLLWLTAQLEPAKAMAGLGEWLSEQSTALVKGSINQVMSFVLTFYFLFYFLRDRGRMLAGVNDLLPIDARQMEGICTRISDTMQATIRGTILVAIVQGTLGGLMFRLLDLPAPAFWGLIMALLTVVPVLGAFVVWIPAVVILALDGQWISAAVLAFWGGLVIAGIDNLLYPVFVGSQLRLHTLVVFVGAVGGLVLFGAPGVILGPVIIVATQSLLTAASQSSLGGSASDSN